MGKSIDGIRNQDRSVGSRIAPTPRPILSMSLQPIIPWRVALQQSPTPLHRLSTMLKENLRLEKTITLNSNCVFGNLSHSRGSPHRTDFASNAQWVIWADLYPNAGCLNKHDTDRAAGESPKHGKLIRRGRRDTTVLWWMVQGLLPPISHQLNANGIHSQRTESPGTRARAKRGSV